MDKYGLVGKNITYSLSPLIHNFLFDKYNIDCSYSLIDVNDLKNINLNHYTGFNVTIPYKEEIVDYLDELKDFAKELNTVNTVLKKNSKFVGYNTDILGFNKFYKKNIKDKITTVGILGNSATAKMLTYYFKNININVIIFSRQINNSKETNMDLYNNITNYDLDFIINTTPLGQGKYTSQSPLTLPTLSKIKTLKYILDFNYNPYNSLLLLYSKKLGLKTFNGLEILVNQAIFSFEIWNNIKVEDDVFNEVFNYIISKVSKGIVVYGMPLSGKSTAYKELNETQSIYKNVKLYELDEEVSISLDQNINEYILENSIDSFRKEEEGVLKRIIMNNNNSYNIIFLGGGTLTNTNIIELLKNYIFVYKNESLESLLQRLTIEQIKNRPLLKDKFSLEELYLERIDFYNKIYDFYFEDIFKQ